MSKYIIVDKNGKPNLINPYELVHTTFTEAEMWGQLAEELSEAAQAAGKMQRLCFEHNKPRKSPEECHSNMCEEIADILNCLRVLEEYGFSPSAEEIAKFRDAKMRRLVDAILNEV